MGVSCLTLHVAPQRIRVEGYADTKPLPEATLAGLSPEDRAKAEEAARKWLGNDKK